MTEFIIGLSIGCTLVVVAVFIVSRCRFGLHSWGRWALTGTGNAQTRTCQECGLMAVKTFPDFTVTIKQEAKADA